MVVVAVVVHLDLLSRVLTNDDRHCRVSFADWTRYRPRRPSDFCHRRADVLGTIENRATVRVASLAYLYDSLNK